MTNKESETTNEEKVLSSKIADKILEYKKNLDFIPVQLIPISQSEKDRAEISASFSHMRSTKTQLLDSKFYNLLVKMNRERDSFFLREGTTKKDRIKILSALINRVTTPQLILNHRHIINITELSFYDNKTRKKRDEEEKEKNYQEPENNILVPAISEELVKQMKERLIKKLTSKTWDNIHSFNCELSHWEADLFSQMARDKELLLEINEQGVISISKVNKSLEIDNVYAILLEPYKNNVD